MCEPDEGSLADRPSVAGCPRCGYDLRGLGNATIRCPECGSRTRRADRIVTPAAMRRTLESLETVATACVACSLGAAAFALAFVLEPHAKVAALAHYSPVAVPLLLLAAVGFGLRYGANAVWTGGWLRVLAVVHVTGAFAAVSLIAGWWGLVQLAYRCTAAPLRCPEQAAVPLVVAAAAVVSLLVAVPRVYRRVRAVHARIQGPLAVRMAQRGANAGFRAAQGG